MSRKTRKEAIQSQMEERDDGPGAALRDAAPRVDRSANPDVVKAEGDDLEAWIRRQMPAGGDDETCQVGSWEGRGIAVDAFFHPHLNIIFRSDAVPGGVMEDDTPPSLTQEDTFVVELRCLYFIHDVVVDFGLVDEDGADVTGIACQYRTQVPQQDVVFLDDNSTDRVVIRFEVRLNAFEIDGNATHCETRLRVEARQEFRCLTLVSKPILIRTVASSPRSQKAPRFATPPAPSSKGNTAYALSAKYWSKDALGPEDPVGPGFVDPGRSNPLLESVDEYVAMPRLEREVLVIPPLQESRRLEKLIEAAALMAADVVSTETRATMLLWLVAGAAFGPETPNVAAAAAVNPQLRAAVESRRPPPRSAVASRKRLRQSDSSTPTPLSTPENVERLCGATNPMCRHRALMYKMLADHIGLPCFLVRGTYCATRTSKSVPGLRASDAPVDVDCSSIDGDDDEEDREERHTWNLVVLGQTLKLVDASLFPTSLMPWPDPRYQHNAQSVVGNNATHPGPRASLLHADPVRSKHITREFKKTRHTSGARPPEAIDLLEEVGRGGSAVVRHATIGGLSVAIKCPKDPSDRECLETIRQEYETILRLRCKYAVRVLGFLTDGPNPGMIMSIIPETVLSLSNQLILRSMSPSLNQIAMVLRTVLRALTSIHNVGMVHRDIKAENVLVHMIRCKACVTMGIVCNGCELMPRLGDYADCITLPTEIPEGANVRCSVSTAKVGTVPYAAPEINHGCRFSFAADLWSVGVLAVEMWNHALPTPSDRNANKYVVCRRDGNMAMVPCVQGGERPTHRLPIPRLTGCANRRGVAAPKWLTEIVDNCLMLDWRKRITAADCLRLLPKTS